MNNRFRGTQFIYAIILCLLIVDGPVVGEQINTGSRFHNLGMLKWRVDSQLWLDTSGNDFTPICTWPQGVYDTENCQFWWFQILPESYEDSSGVHEKMLYQWAGVGDLASQGFPWGIYEYRRYAPPDVWVNGRDDSYDFEGEVTETQVSDVQTTLRMKSAPGFWLTLKTYSFANELHDDYVINHLNIRFTGNSSFESDTTRDIFFEEGDTLKNVWFSLGYHMVPSFAGQKEITGSRWGGEAWDDWMDWEVVQPQLPSGLDEENPDMLMVYAWDGDDTDVTELEAGGIPFDDFGDPSFIHEQKGQFLSYQYPGFTLLHADNTPADSVHNPQQPQTLALGSIFDVWAGNYGGMMAYDYMSSGNRQHPPDPHDPANSHWLKSDHMFMGCGPYNFTLGSDIDLVWSVGVGGVDWKSTHTKGLEWLDWYRDSLNHTFDNAAKREFISQGKDSLETVLSRSRWAWDRIRNGETLPAPLPSPALYVQDGPGRIELEWEDMSAVPDPVTGIPDLDYYRIYRKVGAYLVNFKEDEFGLGIDYELLAEVPGDITQYYDTTAVRGENYHYYVTCVDDGSQNTNGLIPGMPLESSAFQNRTRTAARAFKPAPLHVDSVRVVPNPYIISAGNLNFTGDNNRIMFVNIPAFCTISIYNTTGDLVRRVEHTSGSGDEAWDLLSASRQRVVSGVYIAHLTQCRRIDGKSLRDVIEKFVIIR